MKFVRSILSVVVLLIITIILFSDNVDRGMNIIILLANYLIITTQIVGLTEFTSQYESAQRYSNFPLNRYNNNMNSVQPPPPRRRPPQQNNLESLYADPIYTSLMAHETSYDSYVPPQSSIIHNDYEIPRDYVDNMFVDYGGVDGDYFMAQNGLSRNRYYRSIAGHYRNRENYLRPYYNEELLSAGRLNWWDP
jgi:hypothetical protein